MWVVYDSAMRPSRLRSPDQWRAPTGGTPSRDVLQGRSPNPRLVAPGLFSSLALACLHEAPRAGCSMSIFSRPSAAFRLALITHKSFVGSSAESKSACIHRTYPC
ncbi:hypothetical protein OH77DRAFT_911058 [Trametes cingulata]|nr:hypothetical protein OH77DRAFT_911058 [Trametes cingulata]